MREKEEAKIKKTRAMQEMLEAAEKRAKEEKSRLRKRPGEQSKVENVKNGDVEEDTSQSKQIVNRVVESDVSNSP